MAPIFDDEPERIVQFRPTIAKQSSRLGERAEHIEHRDCLCGFLDCLDLAQGFVAQFLEQLVLEILGAFVSAKDLCLYLL